MNKIKVYEDSGTSLPKELRHKCEPFQFPYDSSHRSKKARPKLASPCELTWKDANCTWEEANFTWEESADPVPERIKVIIGKGNKKDYKHIGSALKMGCKIFLTSDKKDIWSKRIEIENEFGLKIFHLPNELDELINYVNNQLEQLFKLGFDIVRIQEKGDFTFLRGIKSGRSLARR